MSFDAVVKEVITKSEYKKYKSVAMHLKLDVFNDWDSYIEYNIDGVVTIIRVNHSDNKIIDSLFISNYSIPVDELKTNGGTTLSNFLDISVEDSKKIFDACWITLFNTFEENAPYNILKTFSNVQIDLMKQENYFDRYSSEELAELYEKTGNDTFLPKTVKDIFIF